MRQYCRMLFQIGENKVARTIDIGSDIYYTIGVVRNQKH